ncbi:hypothetical protein K469DRAFT_697518 [Zopfia rhizophila CBS 207.26]|uniref:Fungal-type protein kinase domain-containing protein n=1 Tax=Zopfia rhizophila CBS 207.26 TaxID=1314779 RepID=A0A6A6DF50_9PEZI|nr:hypothetical protein K469DRAFT_697518 [Zopfia rhizophila CBS 207.26]
MAPKQQGQKKSNRSINASFRKRKKTYHKKAKRYYRQRSLEVSAAIPKFDMKDQLLKVRRHRHSHRDIPSGFIFAGKANPVLYSPEYLSMTFLVWPFPTMTVLSDGDIVNRNAIAEGPNEICRALKSTFKHIDVHGSPGSQENIARFKASSGLPPVERLRFKTGREALRPDLLGFRSAVLSSDFDLKLVVPLLQLICEHAADQKICDAVIAIITPKSTPLTISSTLPLDTPLKSTSSYRADEQTDDDPYERILQEIDGCIYKDAWKLLRETLRREGADRSGGESAGASRSLDRIPISPISGCFSGRVLGFQRKCLRRRRGTFYPSLDLPLAGYDCKRKPDPFSAPSSAFKHDAARPTRRFLHGLTIRRSTIELWVFDRSGPSGSMKFDIHKDQS